MLLFIIHLFGVCFHVVFTYVSNLVHWKARARKRSKLSKRDKHMAGVRVTRGFFDARVPVCADGPKGSELPLSRKSGKFV